MSQTLSISGLLREKDVKRLTRLTRGGSVGPTAVYYAGVTAPIISASMAVMVREAVRLVGLSPYWQWFISALVAAFAGIAWYLIFIRWSYRHKHGRGTEMTLSTDITLADDQVIVRRGGIETRIDWSCISSVQTPPRGRSRQRGGLTDYPGCLVRQGQVSARRIHFTPTGKGCSLMARKPAAAKMPSQRQLRAGEIIRHALADILSREDLRDPDIASIIVTVGEVRCSPDLRRANVFVTPLGDDTDAGRQKLADALTRAAPFLRGRLSREIDMRFTPELRFIADKSYDEATHIDRLLADPRVKRDLQD
mgnify:CR=1 FL=1